MYLFELKGEFEFFKQILKFVFFQNYNEFNIKKILGITL